MSFQRKQFAVIGLGRFGESVCRTLYHLGHEVLGIDQSAEIARLMHGEDIATHIIQADATDIHALDEVGMRNFDTVVVAIGNDMESSILTVLNLIDLGVSSIVAKASHDKHGKVLSRIGGDLIRVVYPETQMGERIARSISGNGIIESIELDPDYSIIEMPAPTELQGRTLMEADLRARFGVIVIAIKSQDGINIAPMAEDRIRPGDIIALVGPNDRLEELQRKI